jgi:23S rRNA pseudouridine1911/1915/1917 synthase
MKIQVLENITLFDLLSNKLRPASKTKVRKLIKHGSVTVDGKIIRLPDHSLTPGQVIKIERPSPPPPFPIVYEDPFMIALEKPPGLLSIGTEREDSNTFYRAVNHYVQARSNGRERIFIVHRLDREASGVMLFAKTPEIKEALQKNWGETEKRYLALVEGRPPEREGTIKSWLKETPTFMVRSGPEGTGAKYAVTHYRRVKEYSRQTLLEIRTETGRKNQIRVHLSGIGCPIVGDKKYGATGNPFRRLALHASALSFTHPVSHQRIKLESPAPEIFSPMRSGDHAPARGRGCG